MSMLRSGLIVSAMTLLSRLLGFVRDILFAREFAASAAMDAFLIAFKIPNFLRRLFAEGAFNQAFVPTLGEYKATRDKQQVRALIAHVAGTMGGILFLITLLGVLAAPVLVMLFAPGYILESSVSGDRYTLTVDLLRITFPYILFISLVAFAGGILNTWSRFAIPAFTPVVLNIVLISSIFLLAPYLQQPVMALAIAVFVAGALQLLLQLPFLAQLGLLVRPRWNLSHPGVRKIFKLMLPAIFASSISQINLLLDTVLASLLVSGSISWLYYSDRLMELPLGVLGVALATVILPDLSKNHAEQSLQQFSRTLDQAIRWMVILGIPAASGLFVLAGPIVLTLFGSDKFQLFDVQMTAYSLMAYSFGLFGFLMVKVLLPGFYARQDTRTPFKIAIIALLVNMFFNILIVVPWYQSGFAGAHSGLAMATSLSAMIQAALLYYQLRSRGFFLPQCGWSALWLRVIVANTLMIVVLLSFELQLSIWQEFSLQQRITSLLMMIVLAVLTYLGSLWLLGLRSVRK